MDISKRFYVYKFSITYPTNKKIQNIYEHVINYPASILCKAFKKKKKLGVANFQLIKNSGAFNQQFIPA
jgi:hypothetical protein